ncbi:hypothetical protein CTA2_2424, partial [Colletotrichum tanaceti]
YFLGLVSLIIPPSKKTRLRSTHSRCGVLLSHNQPTTKIKQPRMQRMKKTVRKPIGKTDDHGPLTITTRRPPGHRDQTRIVNRDVSRPGRRMAVRQVSPWRSSKLDFDSPCRRFHPSRASHGLSSWRPSGKPYTSRWGLVGPYVGGGALRVSIPPFGRGFLLVSQFFGTTSERKKKNQHRPTVLFFFWIFFLRYSLPP